jgi:hypothetical protein
MEIGGVSVDLVNGALVWTAGLAVDGDGARDCYAPLNSGLPALDHLGNAGKPGNWWGLVCEPTGEPVIQSGDDPCPGYYVSTTALVDRTCRRTDPRRYVDSSRVPYLSVPPELLVAGVHLGDLARVSYRDQWSPAVVGDVGPRGHLGEGSIALARALGLDPSPKDGGISAGVHVVLFGSSSRGWPRTLDDITAQLADLYGDWQRSAVCV